MSELGPFPERMDFAAVCRLVPEGVNWGDHLTPQIAREIAQAAVAAERERMRAAIADDAYAVTFQSMGQYRSALLRAFWA